MRDVQSVPWELVESVIGVGVRTCADVRIKAHLLELPVTLSACSVSRRLLRRDVSALGSGTVAEEGVPCSMEELGQFRYQDRREVEVDVVRNIAGCPGGVASKSLKTSLPAGSGLRDGLLIELEDCFAPIIVRLRCGPSRKDTAVPQQRFLHGNDIVEPLLIGEQRPGKLRWCRLQCS